MSRLPAGVATAKVNAIHIDKSRTYPAPWSKVLQRDNATKPSIPCAPSLYASAAGLHLFYLDDIDNGANGTSLAYPRLWYVKSPDFGKTWKDPVLVSSTPAGSGKSDWAHSALVDDRGRLHVVWRSDRSGAWRVYYQRSDDAGETWLPADVDVNAEWPATHGPFPALDALSFKDGGTADWIKYGADRFRQVAWSPDNRLYVVFSSDNGAYHYLRWSSDGGRTWPAANVKELAKDGSTDLVESVDFIEPANRLMFMTMTGTGRTKRRLISAAIDGSGVLVHNAFDSQDVTESVPPVVTDDGRWFYEHNTNPPSRNSPRLVLENSNSPFTSRTWVEPQKYDSIDNTDYTHIKRVIRPSVSGNDIYLSFVTGIGDYISMQNILFFKKSSDGGNTFGPPTYLYMMFGSHGAVTSAIHNGIPYYVQCAPTNSPFANLILSSIPDQLVFGCSDGRMFHTIIDQPETTISGGGNNTSYFDFANESLRCFSSDDHGFMIYGTNDGVFFRNYAYPGVQTLTGPGAPILAEFNDRLINNGYENRWRHLLNGIRINSAHLDSTGTLWIGTQDSGVFKSKDRCENWDHYESTNDDFRDIKFNQTSTSKGLDRIHAFSRRYIVRDSTGNVPVKEWSLIIGDREHDSLQTVIRGVPPSLIPEMSVTGDKIHAYETSTKSLLVKFFDRYRRNLVRPKAPTGSSILSIIDSVPVVTDLIASTGDFVEVTTNRKYNILGNVYEYFCLGNGLIRNWVNGPMVGEMVIKIGSSIIARGQHYVGTVAEAGLISFFINKIWLLTNQGFAFVTTRVSSPPVTVDMNGKLPDTIEKLVAAPDGKTVFALDSMGRRAYSLADVTTPTTLTARPHPTAGPLPSPPRDVIFSPKGAGGSYKTYLACAETITDLAGAPLFAGKYDLGGAACADDDTLYFVDRGNRTICRVVRANEKLVRVIVEEAPDAIASMPPVILAKKFFKTGLSGGGAGLSPCRDRLNYEFVYTSRDYPTGIAAGKSETWSRHGATADPKTARVYIVDSLLTVAGTLTVEPGTVVKFATPDKSSSTPPARPRAAAIHVTGSGKLVVRGGLSPGERVLFTSLDDLASAPSCWVAPDADPASAAGLPNPQLWRFDEVNATPRGGPRFGDWGAPGGTATPSSPGDWAALSGRRGGLIADSPANLDLNGLDLRYGLISTTGIYPGGTMPPNFDTPAGVNAWSATNVWLVDTPGGLAIGPQTRLDISPNAIVRFANNSSLKGVTPDGAAYPRYSILADGAPGAPLVFLHAGSARPEFETPLAPSAVTPITEAYEAFPLPLVTAGDWNGLDLSGEGDQVRLSRVRFADGGRLKMKLAGSNARFSGCRFDGLSSTQSFAGGDASTFDACLIALRVPGSFDVGSSSCVAFRDCSIRTSADAIDPAVMTERPFFRASGDALLRLEGNLLDHVAGGTYRARVAIESAGVLRDNHFRNAGSGGRASCEVEVGGGAYPAWPTIEGNRFEGAKVAVSVTGYAATARILDGRIRGNAFDGCDTAVRVDTPREGLGAGEFRSTGASCADAAGNLYVADSGGGVTKYSPSGEVLFRFAVPVATAATAVSVAALAVNDTGELYLVDRGAPSGKVRKFDAAGKELLAFGANVVAEGGTPNPSGVAVAVTATSETVLVTDAGRQMVVKFSNEGRYLEELGGPGAALGKFDGPGGVAATADGKFVYLADATNDRVVKVELEANLEAPPDPYFDIESFTLDGAGNWVSGSTAVERLPVKLVVTARKPDGTKEAAYSPAADLSLSIDPVPGPVLWAGELTPATFLPTVVDPSPEETDNGGTLKKEAFISGLAVVYVASYVAVSERCVTVSEAGTSPRTGTVRCRWTAASRQVGEKLTVDLDGTGPGTVTMDFRWIPPGMFTMGFAPVADVPHPVAIPRGFWIAERECTQRQWQAVTNTNPSSNKYPPYTDDFERPVENVSWAGIHAAGSFLAVLNDRGLGQGTFRLPYEAEWEYACRADSLTPYPWGTAWDDAKGWCQANSGGSTRTTGTRSPNPWGLHDMQGNVWEWCEDWYLSGYPGTFAVAPQGPGTGTARVIRGGGFANDPASCRSFYRYSKDPATSANDCGFRLVLQP